MTRPDLFQPSKDGITVYKPENPDLLDKLDTFLVQFNRSEIETALQKASTPTLLTFHRATGDGIRLAEPAPRDYHIYVGQKVDLDKTVRQLKAGKFLHPFPEGKLKSFLKDARNRPFPLLFVGLLLAASFLILMLKDRDRVNRKTSTLMLIFIVAACIGIPDLTLFARILSFSIFATVLSLFTIETRDTEPFIDHFRFLLLIFIYSGFWVMYFQMFDSVLWYVKAYVDSTPLNAVVNQVLGMAGIHINWYFDVEHVTVINAMTIILLQLFVTKLVKHRKALSTMITGILLGTIGMALLAVSTGIWVFLVGIIIFSIGEMTAHPKFISYVGQTAPKEKVAMYMGYLFLYGVIGSSIGGVLGANLYVHFVDHLHQPRMLWIIFAMIGAATIAGLALYNRFFPARKREG
ncbi:MAG: MFS transporter [Holophagae bacterium]|nr:MFS transporter [Holophagae bacterium]